MFPQCTNMWEKGYRREGGAVDVDKGTQGREACWIGYPLSLTSISAKATLPAVQPRYLLQHNVQEDIRYKQISGRSCSLSIGSSVAGKYPTYWNIGGGGSLGVVAALDIGHGEPPAIGLGQPPFLLFQAPCFLFSSHRTSRCTKNLESISSMENTSKTEF